MNICKFGDSSIKRTGLKNGARQRAALTRGRNENGMFLKGIRKNQTPSYTLILPLKEGAPIFKVTKVTKQNRFELNSSPKAESITIQDSNLSAYTSCPEENSFY